MCLVSVGFILNFANCVTCLSMSGQLRRPSNKPVTSLDKSKTRKTFVYVRCRLIGYYHFLHLSSECFFTCCSFCATVLLLINTLMHASTRGHTHTLFAVWMPQTDHKHPLPTVTRFCRRIYVGRCITYMSGSPYLL